MPNHLSILGIIHTAISILAIVAAIIALLRHGKISPASGTGKAYISLTVITCITGLPIMKTGHPTPGHFLGIIILVILPIAIFARNIRFFGRTADYIQTVIMSFTLFLSMIPATVETLTRLPISSPLATSPADPMVKLGITVWFVLFAVGVSYQLIKLKKYRKALRSANPGVKLT